MKNDWIASKAEHSLAIDHDDEDGYGTPRLMARALFCDTAFCFRRFIEGSLPCSMRDIEYAHAVAQVGDAAGVGVLQHLLDVAMSTQPQLVDRRARKLVVLEV
jgi:hypothetical protein